MHRRVHIVALLIPTFALSTATLHAQRSWHDSAQRAFSSCIDSVRGRRPVPPADTTWTPLAWLSANLVLYRPEAGCTESSSEAFVWIGRDLSVDVRFVPARAASTGTALTPKHCDDCMYAQSELVDTLHDIRIEHRRGGIAPMNALFTTRIMPCNDSLVVRVLVIAPVGQPSVGLRVVNSARITKGGRCVASGPLEAPDAER